MQITAGIRMSQETVGELRGQDGGEMTSNAVVAHMLTVNWSGVRIVRRGMV